MTLQQLLGDVPAASFLDQYYLKQPYARAGGCLDLTPLGGWAAVERLLAQPGADVLIGREGRQWDGPAPSSLAEARGLLAQGYSVGIRHAERHDLGLAGLADEFRRALHGPVDMHVYCTPAGQPGFGWHYDAEEVFLLQTHGSKEWWLRKNTVNPWPLVETIPPDLRYEREIMPLLRCTLREGDWLYVPSGYWHRSQAGEESISLSVGVTAATALDLYDFLRPRLLASLRWRQRLPPCGPAAAPREEDLAGNYQELFAGLGQDLAVLLSREQTAEDFLAHWRASMGPRGT